MAYLDDNGLLYLWNKIKALVINKVDKVSGKGLSTNDYTTAEKNKLAGITNNANNYVHPTGDGNLHVPATGSGNKGKILKAGTTAGSLVWGNINKTEVGLPLVDNTSDLGKPISTATKTALEMKVDLRKVSEMPGEYLEGVTMLHLPSLDAPSTSNTLAIASSAFNVIFNANGTYSTRYKIRRTGSDELLWTDWIRNIAFTDNYMQKLDGIASGANNYIHPSAHPATMITADATHRFVTDTEKNTWNAKASTALATTTANGLMAKEDKTKLNGIAAGAEVNQNAFSHVQVGGTTISADQKLDALTLEAGANVTLTPDAGTDKITISSTNTTYNPATQSGNGLMSAADKKKLDAFGSASTYALKADIVGMYKYKGSVADVSKLPTTGQQTGWVYNIVAPSIYGAAGANVAWDGSKWDSLGEIFTITSITNAQIDTICA